MSARIPERVVAAVCGQPWAITQDGLENLLAIITRTNAGPGAVPVIVQPASMSIADGVARIPIRGPIVPYTSIVTTHSGATSLEQVSMEFEQAIADPSVHQVIFDIDSPGGQASGIETFADRVYAARSRKPVVARVESLAASAAYWIASAAGSIEIAETASLGSVGVVMTVRRGGSGDLEIVSSQSPRKRIDPASAEGRTALQQLADQVAEVFVGRVAFHRGVTRSTVLEKFGGGWLVTGRDAIAAGMADRLLSAGSSTASKTASTASFTTAMTDQERWRADASLRAEFGFDYERFAAYMRARRDGRARYAG